MISLNKKLLEDKLYIIDIKNKERLIEDSMINLLFSLKKVENNPVKELFE